jgi:Hemerythrin HHE cation binding domain
MKATTLLERQHRNLRQLCETVEGGSSKVRASLLPQLAGDLVAHMAVETQVFYPAASAALHEDWMQWRNLRHARTMESLERVLDAPVDGEEFARAMGELRGLIELNAAEEENGLFPRIEHALDSVEMRTLALAMMSLYHSEVETGYRRHSENPSGSPIGHAPLP